MKVHRKPMPRLHFVVGALVAMTMVSAPSRVSAEVTTPVLTINDHVDAGEVTVQQLRGGVAVLFGSGGNIAVLTTLDGKMMIDAGIAVSKPKLMAALASLGSAPVKLVVNTHYHWDHTDGNAWLHEAGASVLAHENTQTRLKKGTRVIDWGFTFRPVTAAGLPTVIFKTDKKVEFGTETVTLKHPGTGHTDTDVIAHFLKADVLHVGDIWWNGFYPFIDYSAGGSIDGVIRQVNACIEAATARTIIIPGHGPVGDRAGLVEFRDMLVVIRQNVASLKRQGKTLSETVAAKPTAAYDAKFGQFLIDPAFFTHLVYMGV